MKYVDMAMSPDEAKENYASPTPDSRLPKYPYGLCISLCQDELDKLGIDPNDIELGDFLHLHSLAKVTSVSMSENEGGSYCRVELVLAFLEAEDEAEEDIEADEQPVTKKLYR